MSRSIAAHMVKLMVGARQRVLRAHRGRFWRGSAGRAPSGSARLPPLPVCAALAGSCGFRGACGRDTGEDEADQAGRWGGRRADGRLLVRERVAYR